MKNKNRIAVVDVGTTKVVAVLAELTSNKKIEIVEVVTTKSKGIKRGIIKDIDMAVDMVDDAVYKLREKTNEEIEWVVTNISGYDLRLLKKNCSVPIKYEVKQSDINSLDNKNYHHGLEQNETIIQFNPIYYRTDDEEEHQNPLGKSTRQLNGYYNVLVGNNTVVEELKDCFNKINHPVKKIVAGVLASADAVLTNEEKNNGVVVLDIGGGTTEMAIYVDGILKHLKVIPFGSDNITTDIKNCYDIFEREAAQLKIDFGQAVPDLIDKKEDEEITLVSKNKQEKIILSKDLSKIINARMEEILETVLQEIKDKRLHSKIKSGIVLTGGGAKLKNLDVLVNQKTQLKVRLGFPISTSSIDLHSYLGSLKSATVVGLLLHGVSYIEQLENKSKEKPKKPTKIGAIIRWGGVKIKDIFNGGEEYR